MAGLCVIALAGCDGGAPEQMPAGSGTDAAAPERTEIASEPQRGDDPPPAQTLDLTLPELAESEIADDALVAEQPALLPDMFEKSKKVGASVSGGIILNEEPEQPLGMENIDGARIDVEVPLH